MNPWLSKKGLFALDLGTTKFCIASLIQSSHQSAPQLDFVHVEAQGMRRGMVSDLGKSALALNRLLDMAERQLGIDIQKVSVGISGSHLDSYRCRASVQLNGQIVSPHHLNLLAEQVEQQNQRDDKEIIHTIPINYQIDQRPHVYDPINFSGHMLHGEFLLIFSDQHYMKDVVRLCNQCGLQVNNLFAETVASASVTLSEDLKQRGIAVADIGGGTTDGIVFQHGKPAGVFTVNIAGQMMTHDLSLGLQLPMEEAERVKLHFGLCPDDNQHSLEVRTLTGETKLIVWRDVFQILGPRIRELGHHLVRSLYQYKGTLAGGIMLTGGGSNVKGMGPYLSDLIKVPVRVSQPTLGLSDALTQRSAQLTSFYPHKFATALGLLNLQLAKNQQRNLGKPTRSSRYLSQFVNWLKELS